MKTSGWLVFAAATGALLLQGCAQTGGTRTGNGEGANVPMQVPVTAGKTSTAPPAAIPENGGKPVIAADTTDNFEAVAAAIRQQMQPGGRFAFVNKAGNQTVEANFADMQTLFNQYGSVDKMTPPARARLLADQNAINAVLARYDSNRRICWQEVPVGTHFPKTVCRTLGEIQNEKENSKNNLDEMRKRQSQTQTSPGVSNKAGH